MISKIRASRLLGAALGAALLVLSVFVVDEVLCAGTVEEAAEMVLTSGDAVERALVALQSGQVLPLVVAEVALNTTVVITASNVELRGRPETTRVLCPSDGSALTIRGTNVTLRNLEFTGCTTDSAVKLIGTNQRPSLLAEGKDENKQADASIFDVCFHDCTFVQNNALHGAAVFAMIARLRIEGTVFKDNTAKRTGGAIFAWKSRLSISDASFISNTGRAGYGGAIYLECLDLVESGTRFEDNQAADERDVVLTSNCKMWLTHVGFSGNAAEVGGAICASHCNLTVTDANFTQNQAGLGGAIYGEESNLTVTDASFTENQAGVGGGAICGKESNLTVTDASFTENHAKKVGGAIVLIKGSLNAKQTNFTNNQAGRHGGAIAANSGSTVAMETIVFANNRAENGVGGAIAGTGTDAILQIKQTEFRENTAGYGGAISTALVSLAVVASSFVGNAANSTGGAIFFLGPVSVSSITDSSFERNTANIQGDRFVEIQEDKTDPFELWDIAHRQARSSYGAGAVFVQNAKFFKISNSDFSENRAGQGGAIVVNGQSIATKLSLAGCLFRANEANSSGGAVHVNVGGTLILKQNEFRDNSAGAGGAIFLVSNSNLSTHLLPQEELHFQNNSAIRGGAINCYECVMRLIGRTAFFQNVALHQGGALSVVGAGMDSNITDATFHQNVAAFGGALYLEDCTLFRCLPERAVEFTENIALDGGAVHIKSRGGLVESYKVQSGRFEGNLGLHLEGMFLPTDIPSLAEWQNLAGRSPHAADSEWLRCTECIYGRGGALYIGLHNRRLETSFNMMLRGLDIIRNEAVVGGGIYIEHDVGNHKREIDNWCSVVQPILKPCMFLAFKSVNVTYNFASISGGGVFITSTKNLSPFCIDGSDQTSIPCDESGELDAIRLRSNKIGNDGGGYGPDLATGATHLKLLDFTTGSLFNLTAGEKLAVRDHGVVSGESSSTHDIQFVVKDMLNHTVTGGTKDAELQLTLVSERIAGKRVYTASRGIITISETMTAGINVADTVIFQTNDDRILSVSLNFSTRPCSDGELVTASEARCFRCRSNSYAFDANQDSCRDCEDHASCDGTTMLVPDDFYWHSTPFSPVMRRCSVKKACAYNGRKNNLTDFYEDSRRVKDAMASVLAANEVKFLVFSKEYPQCAQGYTGVLCGSCDAGYGHSSSGACERCDQSLHLTRFLATATLLVLFGVVTFKVFLAITGVLDDVAFELAEEKRAVKSIISSATGSGPGDEESVQLGGTSGGDRRLSETRTDGGVSGKTQDEATSSDAGPSVGDNSKRPLLQRLDKVEDPLSKAEDKDDSAAPSPELMDASANLSDTYNILFNYSQLNSVALSLDVDWTKTLRYFFSIEASVTRMMDVQFLPFDCSLSDRGHDEGFPNSLASLWYRVCFPVFTITVYLIAMNVCGYFYGDTRESKYSVGLPPKRLIFLVVYLSCCIDIFADLLKIMQCVDLGAEGDADHPYAIYEVLESKSVWAEDTSVVCWEGAHLVSAVIAGIGLCVCVGVIGFTVVILVVGRSSGLLKNPHFLLCYGFLYLSYRTESVALYWESVITLRRMLMAAVGVFSSYGETSNVQIGFLAFIIFVFVALHEVVKPFDQQDSKDVFPSYAGQTLRTFGARDLANQWSAFNQYVTLNGMEGASLYMSLSLFLLATCVNDDHDKQSEVVALLTICFAVNAIFVAFMLYRLWMGAHHYLDVAAKEKNVVFQEGAAAGDGSQTSLLAKVWLFLKSRKTSVAVDATIVQEDVL